jgi:hypothetical protein
LGVGLAFVATPKRAEACWVSSASCSFTCPYNCYNPSASGGYSCDCSGACSPRSTCWAL